MEKLFFFFLWNEKIVFCFVFCFFKIYLLLNSKQPINYLLFLFNFPTKSTPSKPKKTKRISSELKNNPTKLPKIFKKYVKFLLNILKKPSRIVILHALFGNKALLYSKIGFQSVFLNLRAYFRANWRAFI